MGLLDRLKKTEAEITKSAPRATRSMGEGSRVDIAAEHIQRLTQRNFRYDRQAEPSVRIKAIQRIRDWWENEGRGLYGFTSARVQRTGGIR